jgi:uncharacterized membrane protein YheB (UPF0754 family)
VAVDALWLRLVLNVAVGTIAGGVTNVVAVKMLFHPREKRFGLQGAIPKNRARLAKSIGRMVGQRLLAPGDVARELEAAGLRATFEAKVAEAVRRVLETERGPLRELLPPALAAEAEQAVDHLVALAADRARRWSEAAAADDATAVRIRDAVRRGTDGFLAGETPMAERLPPGLLGALEHAVEEWLPTAVGRLSGLLHEPAARERIRAALDTLVRRLVGDLKFHERVIAKLVVTEQTLDRALDALGSDGTEQLAQVLDDPAVRAEILRLLREAAERTLAKPPAALLGAPGSPRAEALAETLGSLAVRALQAPGTREAVIGEVERALRDAARGLLDRPIGRPARWLPDDAAARLAHAIAPALWDWLLAQVPAIIEHLSLEEMIERKVQGFPLERVEQLIRDVTDRELQLIVRLGYVLGAIIGVMTFGVGELVRGFGVAAP